MEKRRVLSKAVAVITTLIVLTGLLLSGPAEAFALKLTSDKTSVAVGEKITFVASLDINSNERLPLENFVLELKGPEDVVCEFNVNGSVVSGCKGITIKKIILNSSLGYGYQYGNYNGEDYHFGYGYGRESGKLSYEITLDTKNYSNGTYNTLLKSAINGEVFEQAGSDILITKEVPDLVVYSPDGKNYPAEKIPLKVQTKDKVKKIEYIDWNDKVPVWKELCINCNEYGLDANKLTQFKEGKNRISVRAITQKGAIKDQDIDFFVDSVAPKIIRTAPKKQFAVDDYDVIDGSRFYIKYTEDHLKKITLFYEDKSITKDNTQCASGKNKECVFSADLSKYNGKIITVKFRVEDSVNAVDSKEIRVRVNTGSGIGISSDENSNE